MSEKEIKNNEVAGKKLEDLTDEELKALQGQGDMNGEITPTTITIGVATATAALLSKKVCKK